MKEDSFSSWSETAPGKSAQRHANAPPHSAQMLDAAVLTRTDASAGGTVPLHLRPSFRWLEWQSETPPWGKSGPKVVPLCAALSYNWSSPVVASGCHPDVPVWMDLV